MTLLIMLIKWGASQVFLFFFVTISQFDWPITRKYKKKKTKTLKASQNIKSM
jgi:hypothetical protein